MRILKVLAIASITLTAGACVTRSEFDAYKARIKNDGDNLDEWVAKTHAWMMFLIDHGIVAIVCPDGCGPPPLPPNPPPDGGWE